MSKSIKRTLWLVVVAMMLATALSVAFVFAEPTIYDGGESTLTNNNDNYEIFTIQETEPEVNEEPEGNEEPEQQE